MNVGWTDDEDGVESTPVGDREAGFDADESLAKLRSDRAAEKLRGRNREMDRRREWATMLSLLRGSVDRVVTVHTVDRSETSGTVVEVGDDYVALEVTNGIRWVAVAAVCAVRSPTGNLIDAEASDDFPSMLVDVLDDLIEAEALVSVTVTSGVVLRGEPTSVGATLFLADPSGRGLTAVDLDAIVAIQTTSR